MNGGIFIRGKLLKSLLFNCVVFTLLGVNSVLAQSDNAAQREFAVSWVAAIKSQDEAKVKALFHPATLACINDDNGNISTSASKMSCAPARGLAPSIRLKA